MAAGDRIPGGGRRATPGRGGGRGRHGHHAGAMARFEEVVERFWAHTRTDGVDPPLTRDAISAAEIALGVRLPPDYLALMRIQNGGRGSRGVGGAPPRPPRGDGGGGGSPEVAVVGPLRARRGGGGRPPPRGGGRSPEGAVAG